jgi:hypothetical protein
MKKKQQKTNKKLTPHDYERMWGVSCPYSQVRLCEETRILDDSVSRVFLVVEAEINPFTFEYVSKHREQFMRDESVLQLLDHAEYRGKFGYVVSAGEVELGHEESARFAKKQADMTIKTLIRMHEFVIGEFDLKRNKRGAIKDESRLVWNEKSGAVELLDNGLLAGKISVERPVGTRNNKARFFIVLAFTKDFDFKQETAIIFAKTLKGIAADFNAEMEDVSSFKYYVLITAYLPPDVAPADFIGAILDRCNQATGRPIFRRDYLMTNVKKSTPEQITMFLGRLPQ